MSDGNTARDALVARTVKWAESEKLHPRAIDYAKKYANLTHAGLRLISQYEEAAAMPVTNLAERAQRDEFMREAWDRTIQYMRTMKPAFEESGRKAA